MAASDQPDAIALLKADHRKVEGLFEDFEKARGKARKQELAKTICTELTVHTIIEEEIFYPACRGKVEDDLLAESYVEHDGAKVMIAEIEAGGPDEEFYDAKVKVLSEEIQHHVEEEEKPAEGLFAQARKAGLDMDALGVQLAARKQELMAQIKSGGLPAPETRTFVGGEVERGAPVDEPSASGQADEDRPGTR
ncbi:MAG TPA: hemerythrin domain-containing protein [Caulobacteraceae bacterium]|nr:hemerythrin domain-containing protein [Caulobacteraceae bacterium]